MRVLFVSNAGWSHQGYGVQVHGLLPHLIDQGHDFAIFAYYGLEGGKVDLPLGGQDGPIVTHYPRLAEPFGNDAVQLHAKDFGAECVITLVDAWVLDPNVYKDLNWLAWLPIDQDPIPDHVLGRLPHMKRILPFSRYGEHLVKQTGLPCAYIPHGVDTNVYHCFSEAGRQLAKYQLGFEKEHFVVGMVGANKGFPSRKGFPEAFQAFAKLRESVPEARLYVHSHVASTYGGPHLEHLAEGLGIRPYVNFADQYQSALGFPPEGMAVTYNGFDVLLQSSHNEGFGLPMLEAQACGTPVVAVDATAMTELVAPGYGTLVAPLQKQLTTQMSWVAVPDVLGMSRALKEYHDEPVVPEDRKVLIDWAQQYAWKNVADNYWKPMLDQVATEIGAATSRDAPLKKALDSAIVVEHRHDPSDLEAEPCCPECCDCGDPAPGVEGDRHGCCCEHVVDELEATPGPEEEVYELARRKLQDCPHTEIASELEVWLEVEAPKV